MPQLSRLAWFSPLPPVHSGIASDSAELLELLDSDFVIDRYDEPRAHDFVWKNRRSPYDLVVYQLGNASCHDYMWAYLAVYPGLVALHDPRLHLARARHLLMSGRADDYRREFTHNHPAAPQDFVEYAVEGLSGAIYNLWSMAGVVMRTARMVAVHNPRVADDLRQEFPDTPMTTIRLGKSPLKAISTRAERRRALWVSDATMLLAVFGKITPEKRIEAILEAVGLVVQSGRDVRLLLAGDAADWPTLGAVIESRGLAGRVHIAGHVDEADIGGWLAACDVCLCLRWPTALETSGSWLQCLASGKPTVISDLAHLVDIPTLDPYRWESSSANQQVVAIRIDLLNETDALLRALMRLYDDGGLRERLGQAGHAYWSAGHTMQHTADDYRRVIPQAARLPVRAAPELPWHVTNDYTNHTRETLAQFGVAWEDCWRSESP